MRLPQPRTLWFFFFALILDVFLDLVFIQTNGGGEISCGPDAVLFKVDVFDERELLPEMEAASCFQGSDGIRDGNVGRDFQLEMDMVLVRVHFVEIQCGVFFDGFKEGLFEFRCDILLQDISPPSGAPDDVVLVLVGAVV